MIGVRGVPAFLTSFFRRRPAAAKPAWGKHSPIDLLADSLAESPQGWLVAHSEIRRNGIVISWRGHLDSNRATVSVKMDGQRFPITAEENRTLKKRLIELLAATAAGRS